MRTLAIAALLSILPAAAAADGDADATLAAAAKAQVGKYRCTGEVAEGDTKRKVTSKLVVTRDKAANKLVWKLTQTGKPRPGNKQLMAFVIEREVAADGTWRAVQTDNTGGKAELTAPDGAHWSGTLVWKNVKVAIRDHQEQIGKSLHLWGEYEIEAGVFEPSYDVTCKR
jgi:hypothetical protein